MGSIVQSEAGPGNSGPINVEPSLIYGAAFACATFAFCLKSLFAPQLGTSGSLFAVIGNATCGWSWLATRSLFRRDSQLHTLWPLGAVLFLMLSLAVASSGLVEGTALRITENLAQLGSSAMLLLALSEPLLDIKNQTDQRERKFRVAYALGYLAILGLAVLAVDGAPQDSIAHHLSIPIKVASAIAAVCGFWLALRHRLRHPLEPAQPRRKPIVPDFRLGERLTGLMTDRHLYTEAELRVADLARLAGEAEYKVTQCITGTLGFSNFNQMVNRYRIEEAKRRLVDPDLAHLPILTIALDCGFGSIGPFNRAFKADTGMTPLEFRRR